MTSFIAKTTWKRQRLQWRGAAAAAGGMSIETTAALEKSTARITLVSPKIVESFQHIAQTTEIG